MADNQQNLPEKWQNWRPNLSATLLFVIKDDSVLLIHKKRGLGAGKINGPGGKVDPGETPYQAAVREVEEELCIAVSDAREVGKIHFDFTDGMKLLCFVYTANNYIGTPTETDEAIPLWFKFSDIPYEKMWQDDKFWLPLALANKKFTAYFEFDQEKMLSKHIAC